MSDQPYREGRHLVPDHMWESVVAWIEHAEPHPKNMGTFWRHLLYNDLVGALIAADMVNALNIRNWAEFLHHFAPPYCYGSPEQVGSWWQMHPKSHDRGRRRREKTDRARLHGHA